MMDFQSVVDCFHLYGDFVSAAPYGSGHINDTYAVTMEQSGTPVRYIFQRLNTTIFQQPQELMENIRRVTEHQRQKLAASGIGDISRRALQLVPARDGACYAITDDGFWRVYLFVEKARTYDVLETPEQACEAARSFGRFQAELVDLPGERLHDTIPNFHHTPRRFTALQEAISADSCNRAADAAPEIKFALERESITGHLLQLCEAGDIPERITHNDTKINNVMLDDATHEGICVIDLDTVMPGLALYDFGDLVRTSTSPAAEDERDLSKVAMRLEMFEQLIKGYLSSAGAFLTAAEVDNLVFSGRLITFEIGLRFLTDYLSGDVYFKTHRDGHNLDRCRTQFRLVAEIERQEKEMLAVVSQYC